jgi:hypothetical protein
MALARIRNKQQVQAVPGRIASIGAKLDPTPAKVPSGGGKCALHRAIAQEDGMFTNQSL